MSSFFNFLIKLGVNPGSVEFISGRLLGPLAWANSSNLGGHMNPNFIEEYTQLNAEITAALAKFKNYDVDARQQKITIKNVAACVSVYRAASIKVFRNVALQDLTPSPFIKEKQPTSPTF